MYLKVALQQIEKLEVTKVGNEHESVKMFRKEKEERLL